MCVCWVGKCATDQTSVSKCVQCLYMLDGSKVCHWPDKCWLRIWINESARTELNSNLILKKTKGLARYTSRFIDNNCCSFCKWFFAVFEQNLHLFTFEWKQGQGQVLTGIADGFRCLPAAVFFLSEYNTKCKMHNRKTGRNYEGCSMYIASQYLRVFFYKFLCGLTVFFFFFWVHQRCLSHNFHIVFMNALHILESL